MSGKFFCTNCGTRVEQNDIYCPVCGNRVDFYAEKYVKSVQPTPSSAIIYPQQQQIIQKKESKSTGRVIAIIGALLVIAAIFLPYVSYSVLGFGESISLMNTEDGIIFLIAAIVALLLFCVNSKVLSFIVTIVMAILCYIEYNLTMEVLYNLGVLAGFVDKQIGFYSIIIGTIFIGIGAFVNLFED